MPAPTEKLGRYELIHLLATGGMGEVFVARQEGPGGFSKTVVIKRILRHLAQDQGFIDAFVNEARLAGQLTHPNIAQVYGLEHEGSQWFIAMEYVHGRSLRDVLNACRVRGALIPPAIAVRLASQALQGLHFAHELTDVRGQPLGILHRDVTPENLLVAFNGVVKLVDFGIARAMTGAVTRVGQPKGKIIYMAPELTVPGAVIDRRGDVYSVGVVLAELLTLERPPNVPKTPAELELPRHTWAADPSLAPALNEVLARAMQPRAEDRFDSAHAMSEALESWLVSTGQTVLPADVSGWLAGLFGQDTLDANPAVMPLDQSVGASGIVRALGGTVAPTGPLGRGTAPVDDAPAYGTAPLGGTNVQPPTNDSQQLAPVPAGQVRWLVGVGAMTALVMVTVTALALFPGAPSAEVDAGVAVLVVDAGLPVPPVDAGPVVRPMVPVVPVEPVDAGVVKRPVLVVAHPKPKTGRVQLRVNPWAEVWLGAKKLGVTPLDPIELPAGPAALVLKNGQLGVTRKVVVKVLPGQTTVAKFDLFTK